MESLYKLGKWKYVGQLVLAVSLMAGVNTISADISFQVVPGPFRDSEAYGASWGDYNNDRCPDLFVNHHRQQARLYKNLCNGTFADKTTKVDPGQAWLGGNWLTDHHGGLWGDFDNDGDQDLMVTTGARFDGEFMENEGGIFRERAQQYGVSEDREGRLPLWVDYDLDGDLDMFLQTRTQNFSLKNTLPNKGFINSGRETGNRIHLVDAGSSTNFGLLVDLNDDGSLEYLGGPEGAFPTSAFDMTQIPFIDISSKIPAVTLVADAAIGDFNNDLHNDVVFLRGRLRRLQAKQFGNNRLEAWMPSGAQNPNRSFHFKSNGNLDIGLHTFLGLFKMYIGSNGYHPGEEARAGSMTKYRLNLNPNETRNHGIKPHTTTQAGDRGLYIGYDPVTQEWLFEIVAGGIHTTAYLIITSSSAVSNVVAIGMTGADRPQEPVMLLNTGNGYAGSNVPLIRASDLGALNNKISCVSAAAADFDNDMDIDLYTICGTGVDNLPNILYKNRGNGKFDIVNNAGGAKGPVGANVLDKKGIAESVVVSDYDGDGKVDMYVTNGLQLFPVRFRSADQLYRNTTVNNNRWIEIDLEGTSSNRDGIGAKIYATAGGKTQLREQNGGTHRWSQNDKRIHFGLGPNNSVDLRIEWPGGIVDTFNNVSANKLYVIQEGGIIHAETLGPVAPDASGNSVKLSIQGVTVNESDGNANLSVTLSQASTVPVSVSYSTEDALSARAGSDFVAKTGILTFAVGETAKTLSIDIVTDNIDEASEFFFVNLSDAVNSDIQTGRGRVNIKEDGSGGGGGTTTGLSVTDLTVTEGVGQAQVAIALNPASTTTVTVQYVTKQLSAKGGGTDYKWRGGVLTFNPGETGKIVSIPITDDLLVESDETFKLVLSNASNAAINDAEGIITITDNDGTSGISDLSVSDVAVDESVGSAQIDITLSPASTQTVTVKYATKRGTATGGGSDYQWRGGTLTFNPGDVSKTVSVPVIDDNRTEPDETIRVVLSNATNATIADNEGIITINDNDGSSGNSDQLNVSRAVYFTADKQLWVRVTSDAQPAGSANITVKSVTNGVTKTLGTLNWRAGKGFYQKTFKNVNVKPNKIKLSSSKGGSATATVSQQ
ncbi:MAG: Calx-beta domain-containing protein [Gammaproteobacteria bacterium]